MGHGDDVGQVELALGILVVQTRQPAAQLAIREVNTGVLVANGGTVKKILHPEEKEGTEKKEEK
jgi:hypothetical protein